MYAIGMLIHQTSATGHPLVELHADGRTSVWCLANRDEIPPNHPDYGLFQYEPQDQFCRWVDPATLGPVDEQR